MLLILVAPYWMETPWLPTVLNMLGDIPCQCPSVKDLVRDTSVDRVLKGLALLHLTLLLFKDVFADNDSLPLLSGSGGGYSSIGNKSLPAMLERMGRLVCLRGCTK